MEAAADLGLVTLGATPPASIWGRTALGGGMRPRRLPVAAENGRQGACGQEAGDQREIPCLAGVRQPEIQEKEEPLEAGAVRITGAAGGWI